jgi:hypothetical protein
MLRQPLFFFISLFLNGKTIAQHILKNDTTVVLPTDIYNNFPPNSTNYNHPITISIDSTVAPKKLTYIELTTKADSFFALKKYDLSLNLFLIAFKNNGDMGQVIHRYKTAICFASLDSINEAFQQLFRIAEKGNYYNYYEIEKEKLFVKLHIDKRWEKLLQIIKSNTNKLQEKYTNEIPKIQY